MTNTTIRTALALLASLPALAAAGTATPSTEPDALTALVGTWKATGTLSMGGAPAQNVTVTWVCKATSAKAGVQCNLKMTGIPGMTYECTDLFGYEPNSKTFHWYAVSNAGETHDHVGSGSPAGKSRWVATSIQDGKPFKEVIDMSIEGRALTIRAETFLDGKSTSLVEAKGKK